MQKIIFIFACVVFFVGCATGRNAVHDNGSGADTVRSHIEKLGEKQTDAVITNTELKGEVAASRESVENLERTVTDGADDLERFKAILQRIRERGGAVKGSAGSGATPAPKDESATQ